MPLPPAYNPVYNLHVRLIPEPSIHANPLLQTPPVPHLEGLHTIQWLSQPKLFSSTVRGDCLRFAFKDHDSGRLIPHVPLPVMAGPFLLDTLEGSKYQILFHQPNVLLDGVAVGVFQWGIAPPWRCIEVSPPLPRFLARAGRAARARGALGRIEGVKKKLAAGEGAREAWSKADTLQAGMRPLRELEGAHRDRPATGEEAAAFEGEQRRLALLELEERQRSWRDARSKALEEKREYDRLSRRSRQLALQHDSDASAAFRRAQLQAGAAQRAELLAAEEHRAQAASVRNRARAWAAGANEREAMARAWQAEARRERAEWRKVEEQRALKRGSKKANPVQQATGASNAGLIAPSLFAHLPFPGTVEIQVSWGQIGKTWIACLVGAAAAALKYYVGFIIDGIAAPGRGKLTGALLDLVKSGINDTLIDGGAKYLVEGTWPLKLSKKLGPVQVSASCELDPATGTRKWKASLGHKSQLAGLGPSGSSKVWLEGHGATPEKYGVEAIGWGADHVVSRPPADYAHGVPAVN